jgi:hypothetical protein
MDIAVPMPTAGVELHLDGADALLTGQLGDLSSLASQVEVRGVVLRSPEGAIEMRQPLRITGVGPDLELTPAACAVGPQEITLQGTAHLGAALTYRLEMEGTSDLKAWQPFTAPVEGAGNLALDVVLEGTGSTVRMAGGAELTAGYFRLPDFPHALEGVYARVDLENTLLRLTEMRGNLGGGRVEGSGEIALAGPRPLDPQDDGVAHRAWADQAWAPLASASHGVYVNFLQDDVDDRTPEAYRGVMQKLSGVKAKYDPENIFQFNQNVRPAAQLQRAAA